MMETGAQESENIDQSDVILTMDMIGYNILIGEVASALLRERPVRYNISSWNYSTKTTE